MNLELTRKTAIITGGSKGAGRSIVVALAEEVVNVAIRASWVPGTCLSMDGGQHKGNV